MTELELMRMIIEQAPGPACLTCSFQAEDVVVLDMLRQIDRNIPVLFLDTGCHFPELLRYRDRLVDTWGINLVNVKNPRERSLGPLYLSDPTACCRLRKVEPLMDALESYSVWFTGLRREQSPTRASLATVDTTTLPSGRRMWKVSPLAAWKWNGVWSYLRIHEIPCAPLYDEGYTSIGCAPCTTPPTDPADARSGRWGGVKLECGIHIVGQAH